MSWINGRAAARAAMEREAMASPRRGRDEAVSALTADAESQRGKGTGGWADSDIDDFTDELSRLSEAAGRREQR